MKAKEFFKSKKEFLSKEEIKEYISNSVNFDENEEDSKNAETILLFRTSNQKTWLIVTNKRMYCILDDLRKNKPIIAWSKSKFELVDNANIKLDLIQNDKSEDVGVINIGPKNQDWYFTKSLFDTTDLISSITGTIQKKMLEE